MDKNIVLIGLGILAAFFFNKKKHENNAEQISPVTPNTVLDIWRQQQPEQPVVIKPNAENEPKIRQPQKSTLVPWTPPLRAEPYLPLIQQAEKANNMPPTLLARILDIESAYRDDIITGKITSPVGAVGIAQIVPRWHPNVNPKDPTQAIPYAAKYITDMYKKYGSWQKAVAAYNWGPGNLNKFLAGTYQHLPLETSNYLKKLWGTDVV